YQTYMVPRNIEHYVHGSGIILRPAAQNRGQRLARRPRDVELRLLRGERYAGGLGVEAQLPRPLLLRAVSLAHPARPYPPGGAELRDLLEEIDVRIEEEGETGREIIDVHS